MTPTNIFHQAPSRVRHRISCVATTLVFAPLVFFASLSAQVITTPPALVGWGVTGTPPVAGPGQSFALPAGTEVSRSFQASQVTLRLLSSPVFGSSPQDWSTVEVGPASLTFLKDRQGGGVVMLGDVALQLPVNVTLGSDGRSSVPLDFLFVLDRAKQSASVTFSGRNFTLPATARSGPVNVVISAGKAATWPVELLEVQSTPELIPVPTPPPPNLTTRPRDQAEVLTRNQTAAARAAERKQNFADALTHHKAGNPAKVDEALTKSNRYLTGTAGWQIETASKLTQFALSLRQRYDARGAVATARRALLVLQEAERLSASAILKQRASVQEMMAFIHEEILRDYDAARAAYQRAVQIDGASLRSKQALDRMTADRASAERITAGQRKGGGS